MIRSLWISFLAFQFIASTGCALLNSYRPSSRLVSVNGVEITAEEAGHRLFQEAMDARQDKNDETAKHLLAQVVKKYHDTAAAHLAYVELGRLFLDHAEAQKAQRILEVFLVKHPYSEAADEGRYLLALSKLPRATANPQRPSWILLSKTPAAMRRVNPKLWNWRGNSKKTVRTRRPFATTPKRTDSATTAGSSVRLRNASKACSRIT